MFDLPLFPLNTVLFPGQPLSLHIFEDRYKEMINLCVETQQPFGVVLLESGAPEGSAFTGTGYARPHRIGCTARIVHVQRLLAGRMNIIVQGDQRFRIHDFRYDRPYLIGMVEFYPFNITHDPRQKHDTQVLAVLVRRYMTLLEQAGRLNPEQLRLPQDSATIAAVASLLLQEVSMSQKQALLASDDLHTLIRDVIVLYRREIMFLRAILAPPAYDDLDPFSLN